MVPRDNDTNARRDEPTTGIKKSRTRYHTYAHVNGTVNVASMKGWTRATIHHERASRSLKFHPYRNPRYAPTGMTTDEKRGSAHMSMVRMEIPETKWTAATERYCPTYKICLGSINPFLTSSSSAARCKNGSKPNPTPETTAEML